MAELPPRSLWRVKREVAAPEPPQTENLLETGVDAIPVRIVIQQDGFITGWDDGALGFEDSVFWFSGRVTSFRVSAKDISAAHQDRRDAHAMTTNRLLKMGFPLLHPTRAVYVRVAVLYAKDRKDWQDEERIAMEIRRLWLLNESDGESQYPPLAPRPGATVWAPSLSADTSQVALFPFIGSVGGLLSGVIGLSPASVHIDPKGRTRLLRKIAEEGNG